MASSGCGPGFGATLSAAGGGRDELRDARAERGEQSSSKVPKRLDKGRQGGREQWTYSVRPQHGWLQPWTRSLEGRFYVDGGFWLFPLLEPVFHLWALWVFGIPSPLGDPALDPLSSLTRLGGNGIRQLCAETLAKNYILCLDFMKF